MNIEKIKLSASQIRKMKHAIGLDHDTQRRSKKNVHRNFYAAGDDPEWNDIVEKGLAVKRADPFNKNCFVYHLNEHGVKYISSVIDRKIICEYL